MTLVQTVFLGILQGITEFFPVSSSGHLALAQHFLGIPDVPLAYDVLLHVGSLFAIILFFYKEWLAMAKSVLCWKDKKLQKDRTLLGYILLGTIPVLIAGPLLKDVLETLASPFFIAFAFLFTALVFLLVEKFKKQSSDGPITKKQAIIVGCGQVIGLLPGVSRSGITISSGLFAGIERSKAARFSFLLGTPAIAGAALLELKHLPTDLATLKIYALGTFISFLVSILSITSLIALLKKTPLWIFSVYLTVIATITLLLTR